jgi:hypothetical protein
MGLWEIGLTGWFTILIGISIKENLSKKYWDRTSHASITNNFKSKNFDARINK